MKFSSLTPREQAAYNAWVSAIDGRRSEVEPDVEIDADDTAKQIQRGIRAVIASADRTREACANCDGSGRLLPSSHRVIASAPCAACHGSGKAPPVETREAKPCEACHGRGGLETEVGWRDCPRRKS